MKHTSKAIIWIIVLATASFTFGQPTQGAMAFTISMPQPSAHTFHVNFRCEGLRGELQDFEIPAWMPGYYRIMDYQKNVSRFLASDGAGHALPWEKTTKNTWRVVAGNAPTIVLDYDVFGNVSFAAQNFLSEERAFIAPPGLFMYVPGLIRHPVVVTIVLPPGWKQIATGLDPVAGKPNTFFAPDFDTLFDCPILMGNQESRQFEVKGVPHKLAIENVPETVDRQKMLADLKLMVEAATGLMADIPYKHYTFLLIGTGNGGIEHLNSAAIAFNGKGLVEEKAYRRWLSYVAHEYFHHFNVKRIRPVALGPFDYETENLTDMLWVSEGLSVYYQDIVLVRAGLMTMDEYLDTMRNAITRFEAGLGRHFQSATESSLNTWNTSGMGAGERNTTISYYTNGAMLGTMLDLKIRNDSQNRKSLDDVMRAVYRRYALEKKRGFTDAEFREECEKAAGGSLAEVFEYVSTTKEYDYAKYFALAGLRVEMTPQKEEAPGAYLGANTQTRDGKLMVSDVAAGSPGQGAGLSAGDEILELDGAKATTKVLADLLLAKKPGEKAKIRFSRNGSGAAQDVEVTLEKYVKFDYGIKPADSPTPLQSAILKDWLRKAL